MYPDGMRLPYTGGVAVVEPMVLTMAGGGLIEEICRGEALVNLRVSGARYHLSSVEISAGLNIGVSEIKRRSVEVRTSAMQVRHVPSRKAFITNKVDMSVGSLDLSIWGEHESATGAIDMVVGLPAELLERTLGLSGLPEGFLLPVALRGTTDKPEVDYAGTAKRLASLIVRKHYYATLERERNSRPERGRGQSKDEPFAALGRALTKVKERVVTPLLNKDIEAIEKAILDDMRSVPTVWELPYRAEW